MFRVQKGLEEEEEMRNKISRKYKCIYNLITNIITKAVSKQAEVENSVFPESH